MNWLRKIEAKLDEYGKPAWIAAMVVGFIVFWPIGLATLGYMIWSGRMGCWGRGRKHGGGRAWRKGATGNRAFDEYRDQMLTKLEEEREAFVDFLERLRKAKDKAEFDQFLEERDRGQQGPSSGGAASSGPDASGGGFQGGQGFQGGPGFQPAG